MFFLQHLLHNMLHLFYNGIPLHSTFVKKYLRKSPLVIFVNDELAKDLQIKCFTTNYLT